jgi:predicted negative regulator of RcsB-dependent stress response
MANQLDLEEQEQLDQLKHFWKQYGNTITWALIAVLSLFVGWNLYQRWQGNKAQQAAALYDEVERVVNAGDATKIDRVFFDMKDKFGSTTFAQQAGLLVAKQYYNAGNVAASKAALAWVADTASDPGYQAIARLRMAGVLAEAKDFDEALKQLSGSFPPNFEALVADRKADIYMLQGKKKEALVEYQKAYKSFDDRAEYRRLVEVKLNALGVDPTTDTNTKIAGPEGKK